MSVRTFPNYIDGAWVEGPTFENRNPANTGEVVGLHVSGTPSDIACAAAAAEVAFPAWSDECLHAARCCTRWRLSCSMLLSEEISRPR